MSSIKISDKVYDKQKFINSSDIEFRELINNTPQITSSLPSVEDFFIMYDLLFFEIPETGVESHTTLIEKSSSYLGLNTAENIDITTLIDEITLLRSQVYDQELLIKQLESIKR